MMIIKDSRFKIQDSRRGFTLLETLVAIAVFMLAIAGPMTLAVYSMRSFSLGRNQITAYYLAEDALEYVKNTRDTNRISGEEWIEGMSACSGGVNTRCYVDTVNDDWYTCDASIPGDCDVNIKYDSSTGFYNYLAGSDTIFTRTIHFKEIADHNPSIPGDDEARITVEVSWQEKTTEKSFKLEGYMFDL